VSTNKKSNQRIQIDDKASEEEIKQLTTSSQTNTTTSTSTSTNTKATNKRRRPERKTLYNDDDSNIYGEEEKEIVDTKTRKKRKKSNNNNNEDDNVKLDDLKFSILGRKLETNIEMSVQDHLDYYKNNPPNDDTNNHRHHRNNDAITTTTTTNNSTTTTNNNNATCNDSAVVSSQNLETLRSELMCPICHEVLLDPFSLPCGHSFCSGCLSWWESSSSSTSLSSSRLHNDNEQQQQQAHLKCPTCRTELSDRGGCKSLRVNTCLRACAGTLFPEELRARLALRKKTTSGENGGSHSRGYEIVMSLQESPQRSLLSKNGRNNDDFISVKRSVVMDSNDQRMRLALAVYGPIQQAVKDASEYHGDKKDKTKNVIVTLCLLHLEEDEAEEGIPFLVQKNGDDEEFITKEDQFSSLVDFSLLSSNGRATPMSRRQLSSNGTVVFSLRLDVKKYSTTFSFYHEETGLQLILEISKEGLQKLATTERKMRSKDVETNFSDEEDSKCTDDSDESEDNKFVYGVGGRDTGEYEKDGFVESDVEDEDAMSQDECNLCGQGGELLICDGGDHSEGCRRSFHITCLGLSAIPNGDWICSSCADTLGFGTSKVGHEFTVEDTKEKEDDESDDCEFSIADSEESSHNEGKKHKHQKKSKKERKVSKRRIITESDDDE
jgi:ribosomal protein L37AE/L43A